jgi:hypothetical protein
VPADPDLHWSLMRKNAYIWRKGFTNQITDLRLVFNVFYNPGTNYMRILLHM